MNNSQKSFLVYDDDCGFCLNSMGRLKKIIGDEINYIGRSQFNPADYGLTESDLLKSIRFVEYQPITNSYKLYAGAEAIFRALSYNPLYSLPLVLYKHLPFFALISNFVYAQVAKNRKHLSKLSCTVSKPKI